MAVLVEAISVIIRRTAIEATYPGGWSAFLSAVPNGTLCHDADLARVGFMLPADVAVYIKHLTEHGLRFVVDGKAQDIVVVDQVTGPTAACEWLEHAQLPFGDTGGTVGACWLFLEARLGPGIHVAGTSLDLHTPAGWNYERSLSRKFTFIPKEEMKSRLEFLRHENGQDVFLDHQTGKTVFMARTG